jgi:hypothetical protein
VPGAGIERDLLDPPMRLKLLAARDRRLRG